MAGLLPILVLLAIAVFAWIAVRAGAIALAMTGIGRDIAHFQAASAFFGVGFTTREAELVTNHPVRRRIITGLMIGGNIGLTGAISTLVITFVGKDSVGVQFQHAAMILVGLLVLLVFTRMRLFQLLMDRLISTALTRFGVMRSLDYELLLRAAHGYVVSEYAVDLGSGLVGQTLRNSALRQQGLLVLGIARSAGDYDGNPAPDTPIEAGDTLTVYGLEKQIKAVLSKESKAA